jgi:hypothetical protein
MSTTDLVHITPGVTTGATTGATGPNALTAIQAGGIGLSGRLFQLKPSTIEIVQKMTRQEGAIPGKLRDTATNVHYDEMQVVMLFEPVEQRAYFEGDDFSKDSKLCFSLDNLKPHEKAAVPQAMHCGHYDPKGRYVAQCKRADWTAYRKVKIKENLPKCRSYWHLVLADRLTKLPYYFNVKGKSIAAFEVAMQRVASIIALMQASGETPNIFDVSFRIFVTQEKGAPNYILGVKDIAPLAKEARADFGALFLEFSSRRAQGQVQDAVASEEAAVAKAIGDANDSVAEVPAGVFHQGTVVGPSEVITI